MKSASNYFKEDKQLRRKRKERRKKLALLYNINDRIDLFFGDYSSDKEYYAVAGFIAISLASLYIFTCIAVAYIF
jgi:hypothetical protein